MDKNTIIGFTLIAGILVFFMIFNRPNEEQLAERKRIQDSIIQANREIELERSLKEYDAQNTAKFDTEILSDSTKAARAEKEYGVFSTASIGEEKYTVVESDLLKLTFSNKGGKIYSVVLKDYQTHDSLPLKLFDGDSTMFGIGLSNIGKSTNGLYFEPTFESSNITVTDDSKTISYKLYTNDRSGNVEFIYTIPKNDYMIKYDVKFNNLSINDDYLNLKWEMFMPSLEKGKKWESDNTTIKFKYSEDDDEELDAYSSDEISEKMDGKVRWIAFKQQFFSSILIADDAFDRNGRVTSTPLPTTKQFTKQFSADVDFPFKSKEFGMRFYFGPNHYNTLKQYDESLEKLIPLGWGIFGWVNRFAVIPLFGFLSKFISNYGIIILLMTIIIKAVLFPLTYKSYLSTAKMRVLKPEVEELAKKFPKQEQAMEKQQATMNLYKRAGVNPMGGCIPLLIQMPILIAMFRFFPASIELRQKSFLWASDLSTYDSICNLPFEIPFYGSHISLFTLLMAGSMILSTKLSNNNMTTSPGQPNMKFMMWLMPIMMLFWFNNYSSGLSYYYFIANMITFIQTLVINRTVDEEEILRKLKENKNKPVKKSKWAQRLEEMQRLQREQMKNRK